MDQSLRDLLMLSAGIALSGKMPQILCKMVKFLTPSVLVHNQIFAFSSQADSSEKGCCKQRIFQLLPVPPFFGEEYIRGIIKIVLFCETESVLNDLVHISTMVAHGKANDKGS